MLAAVKGGAQQQNKGHNQRGGRGGGGRGGPKSDGQPSANKSTAPADLAQTAAGLCWYHWKFGGKAQKCDSPCKWEGN
jgi:hypothetical protein